MLKKIILQVILQFLHHTFGPFRNDFVAHLNALVQGFEINIGRNVGIECEIVKERFRIPIIVNKSFNEPPLHEQLPSVRPPIRFEEFFCLCHHFFHQWASRLFIHQRVVKVIECVVGKESSQSVAVPIIGQRVGLQIEVAN